ncbi:MAG TPA: amino acid adenylation domain-containing protein [Pyrinomonadaceae bacterium]|nr:amino acid adenylation domain-containing protein [Pyrinomonadaceae bacterium]
MQSNTIQGARLSPQQRRLWLLQQGGSEYHAQGAVLIEGTLAEHNLKAALQTVVERHEILRTTFRRRVGIKTPLQSVNDEGAFEWQVIEVTDRDETAAGALIGEHFERQASRPFDFSEGPLLRAALLVLSARQHVLLLDLPAMCADARTLPLLVREIGRNYDGRTGDDDFSEEPLQYADYAEWQNELLESSEPELSESKDYWLRTDFSAGDSLKLPFEKRPVEETSRTSAHVVHIPPPLMEKIEAAARLCDASAVSFLRACWLVLLYRLTGQREVVILELSEGRKYEELRHSVGLFDRWLPIKCLCEPGFTLKDIVRQSRRSLRDATGSQEFFDAERILKPAEDSAHASAAPVGFEFVEQPAAVETSGPSFLLHRQEVCFERLKLRLALSGAGASMEIKLHYAAGWLDAEEVELIASRYTTLLDAAARDVTADIDELDILAESERERLLFEWNQPASQTPPDVCIHELFEQQVARTPERVALVFEGRHLTYAQLDEYSNRIAHYLKRHGVGAESVVAICLERSLEVVAAMLGVLKAGGAYMPLDPIMPKARLTFMLEETRAPLLITQESLLDTVPRTATRVICLEHEEAAIAAESVERLPRRADAANMAYALYTSGSTGTPKAVVIEHRQLVSYTLAVSGRLRLPEAASFAMISTFAADLGNTAIYPTLCSGGSLHVISQERTGNAASLANYFRRHRIDCLKIVPSHLAALMTYAEPEQVLPRKRLVLGGESCPRELVGRVRALAPDCEIINHYGPTETTVGVLTSVVTAGTHRRDSSAPPLGRPLDGARAYIIDTHMRPAPIGLAGELHIGGAGVGRGYLGRPDLTADRFVPDPFSTEPGARLYRTGDVARYLPDGEVEFLGRRDGQVKVRGYRVELREIEAALREHAGVREAAVVAQPLPSGEKRIAAYIVFRGTQSPGAINELRDFLKERMPPYMLPAALCGLDALPLTPNGKLDVQALPSADELLQHADSTYVEPRTAAERSIASIWREVLSVEKVGLYDNFFDLGGHSLFMVQVHSNLLETFERNIPILDLFKYTTVSSLARYMTEQHQAQPSLQHTRNRSESRRASLNRQQSRRNR